MRMHVRVMLVNNNANIGTDRTYETLKKTDDDCKLQSMFNTSVDLTQHDVVRCKEIVVRMRCDDDGGGIA